MLEQTRNASAEKMPPASQLATLLDDLLANNLQGSLTEMTQYLEMKFINENNPDVQAARMKDVSSLDSGNVPASDVELEGLSSIAAALEHLMQDVSTMSISIENHIRSDTYRVESLASQVNMLTSRIQMINEREHRKKI